MTVKNKTTNYMEIPAYHNLRGIIDSRHHKGYEKTIESRVCKSGKYIMGFGAGASFCRAARALAVNERWRCISQIDCYRSLS